MPTRLLEADRVQSIIGAFYAVYSYYGFGLAESVYVGALEVELRNRGHSVVRELAVDVRYRGVHVAWQRLDLVVDDRVIIESKATELLPPYAKRQLVAYLRATAFQVGVLLHFGPEPRFWRFIDSPKREVPGRTFRDNNHGPR